MSNSADIDKIFKEGIGDANFSNRDAMWQKMEAALDSNGSKRKRRFAVIILFACLLTAGFFAAYHFKPFAASTSIAIKAPAPVQSENSYNSLQIKTNVAVDIANPSVKKITTNTPSTPNASNIPAGQLHQSAVSKGSTKFTVTGGEEETAVLMEENASDNRIINRKEEVSFDMMLPARQYASLILPGKLKAVNPPTELVVKRESKSAAKQVKKISVEVIAGCDALRMNRSAGYYVGVRVNRLLDNGTVASIGLNYNGNSVNDKYRLSSKPAEQWEADAKINDIRSIRLPVYFQRQLAGSKFALMAGLVPTYILDATVYNVPNSFTGDPNAFRKFTMKDINRFNILFGAGIKYSPLQRVSFELSGSYGFTSLVKDSYKNKSRVNDNFKSIQAGVVFRLK